MAENTESDSLPYKAIIENTKPDLDAKARALAVFHSGLWIHFMKYKTKSWIPILRNRSGVVSIFSFDTLSFFLFNYNQ